MRFPLLNRFANSGLYPKRISRFSLHEDIRHWLLAQDFQDPSFFFLLISSTLNPRNQHVTTTELPLLGKSLREFSTSGRASFLLKPQDHIADESLPGQFFFHLPGEQEGGGNLHSVSIPEEKECGDEVPDRTAAGHVPRRFRPRLLGHKSHQSRHRYRGRLNPHFLHHEHPCLHAGVAGKSLLILGAAVAGVPPSREGAVVAENILPGERPGWLAIHAGCRENGL